jgi:hypothetical protein
VYVVFLRERIWLEVQFGKISLVARKVTEGGGHFPSNTFAQADGINADTYRN